jgi:hypothetical protein
MTAHRNTSDNDNSVRVIAVSLLPSRSTASFLASAKISSDDREPAPQGRPGCSRDQKQPYPDENGPGGSRDALTGWCKTLDGDGCRHDSHRAKVHDPDNQEDRDQTGTAAEWPPFRWAEAGIGTCRASR